VLSGDASDAGLDPTQVHYVTSYSAAELRTFHSERVRKMPLSGLDPSMLIGFLCKTEADWIDLRRRVAEVREVDVCGDVS
jgi:cysteine protease ATG4